MTVDPADLAAQSLEAEFKRQVRAGTFPSVQGLRELETFAAQCRRSSSSGDRAVVAFVLERICAGWAYDMDERAVSRAEADALRQKILAPVNRAIEFLNGAPDNPLLSAADLVGTSP